MCRDSLQALLLPLSQSYEQGRTTSTSAASVLPLCTRTHYKHFCCLCPTLMYKDPLQALLLLLSYPYVQGPTTSTSAASIVPLCTGTHYKHFCCLCPTLMYKDPLQALLLLLSYPVSPLSPPNHHVVQPSSFSVFHHLHQLFLLLQHLVSTDPLSLLLC